MSIKVAIIKPVDNGCNLHCKYCYADGQPNKIKFMSIDTAKKIVDELFHQSYKTITFLWHGGEPMLRGIDFFSEIFNYQEAVFKDSDIEYRNAMQTNFTLFNKEWAIFLKKYNVTISTSIDGTKELHNKNRVFANGLGSFDKLVNNIKLAQSYGIKVNALCVVSKENVKCVEEICKIFNELNIPHVGFLPCFKKNKEIVEYPSLYPTEFGNFMINMFELFLNGSANFEIREFEQIIKSCFSKKPNTCSFSGNCNRFISIDSQGVVYSCDTELNDNKNKLGCIINQSLKDIVLSKTYKNYMNKKKTISYLCKQCEYLNYCNNGCPNKQNNDMYYFCEDRKIMFKYLNNVLYNIINK